METVKKTGAKLTIFVVNAEGVDTYPLLEEVASRCREAGIDVDTKIGEGDPAEAIAAQSGMFDLVMMGTMSKCDGKVLHDGVTQSVILNSACPVTVIRAECKECWC